MPSAPAVRSPRHTSTSPPVRSTLAYRDLPQDVQDRIVADVGTKGLVEVITLCGLYALIAMVSAAFDVPVTEAGVH